MEDFDVPQIHGRHDGEARGLGQATIVDGRLRPAEIVAISHCKAALSLRYFGDDGGIPETRGISALGSQDRKRMSGVKPRYSIAKRVLARIPGSREALAAAFMRLPGGVSFAAYELARHTVFRDNKRRLPVFRAAFAEVRQSGNVGDYLEFGVARGTSLISAARLARSSSGLEHMRFHAFDSFEGLPGDEGEFAKGDMAYGEDVFSRFVTKAGVSLDKVTITKGFFDTSLAPQLASNLGIEPGRAHIIHVDCDLYRSTVPVLRFIAPLLGWGSVIIFDDWFSFENESCPWQHGEQRAFAEWNLRDQFDPLAITHNWNAAWKLVRT